MAVKWEIWGSRSGVAENSSLWGCYDNIPVNWYWRLEGWSHLHNGSKACQELSTDRHGVTSQRAQIFTPIKWLISGLKGQVGVSHFQPFFILTSRIYIYIYIYIYIKCAWFMIDWVTLHCLFYWVSRVPIELMLLHSGRHNYRVFVVKIELGAWRNDRTIRCSRSIVGFNAVMCTYCPV